MTAPVVLHTGPAEDAPPFVDALSDAGFAVRPLPAIRVAVPPVPPDLLRRIADERPYSVVVLTSRRAVGPLREVEHLISGAQIAAVGPTTASAARTAGFRPMVLSDAGVELLVANLAARACAGSEGGAAPPRVLWLRGESAPEDAMTRLREMGARVLAPPVYRTESVVHAPAAVREALAGAVAATFTSPSGVGSFAASADGAGHGAAARALFAACLGATTGRAAEAAGFARRACAAKPSPAALAAALRDASETWT